MTSGANSDGFTWTAEVRHDDGALAAVSADWDELHRHCATATPFQYADWLRSWWEAYGRPGTLRLALVRRDGLLVAGAALTARRRRGRTVLTPVGSGVSDFEDVLVHDDVAPQARHQLGAALLAEPGWDLLQVRESRPGGPIAAIAADWPGPSWGGPGSTCLQIPVAGVPEVLSNVGGRTAKTLRKKLRTIDTEGFTATRVSAEQADDGIRMLLAMHHRQWQGRPVNPEHLSAPFALHLTRAGADLVRTGRAVLHQYRLAGRVVASELVLVGKDFAGAYLFGFEPELRATIDVATMLIRQDLITAAELDLPTLSLLRGAEPYKMRWRPMPVQNAQWALARPASLPGAAYVRYRRARVTAVTMTRRRVPWLIPARLGGAKARPGPLAPER